MKDNNKKIVSGFLSGTLSAFMFYPLEVLRVKYLFSQTTNTFENITRGIYFNIAGNGLKSIVTYGGQEFMKEKLLDCGYGRKSSQIYSGSATGILISLICNPFNSIKVSIQASPDKTSAIQAARNIYNNYGLSGFYRGSTGLLLRDLVWTSAYFPLFGFTTFYFNRYFGKENDDMPIKNKTIFLSSGISSVTSAMLAYPFDSVRLYRQHHNEDMSISKSIRCALKLTKTNIQSFCIGTFRAALSITFTHTSYLYIKNRYLR